MAMKILPTDLPRLRDQMVAETRRERHAVIHCHFQDEGIAPALDRSGHKAARFEEAILRRAELFYVEPDMLDLAKVAGRSMPIFSLDPADVPSGYGMIYLAEPLSGADEGSGVPIRVFSWTCQKGAVVLNAYIDRDEWLSPDDELVAKRLAPPLIPSYPSCYLLGKDYTAPASREKFADLGSTYDLWTTLKAIWLLMAQSLAQTVTAGPSKRDRKLAKQAGEAAPTVRVIKLRRSTVGGASGSAREWNHQWLVRGHWRMQPWGPRRERVRPVWIAPHVKGPEGKPMLGGEKVYHLAR